jgi:hypothetical protein
VYQLPWLRSKSINLSAKTSPSLKKAKELLEKAKQKVEINIEYEYRG